MKSQFFTWMLTLVGLTLWIAGPVPVSGASLAEAKGAAFYEMRTYYATPGKLEDLQARFRNHTLKLFEKHGMKNIGYWVPTENPENKLIYILEYPSREAREKSWKSFGADPEWHKAAKESEANGKLVAKAESLFLTATDYSPAIAPYSSDKPRLFELRTYTASPGKLSDLNRRFRDHTLKLFTKHGMTNVGYWVPADSDKGAENTLIYIVAHRDQAASEQSWKAFRADPEWTAAKSASEVNGSLTAPNGVKSLLMKPTDYSPTR